MTRQQMEDKIHNQGNVIKEMVATYNNLREEAANLTKQANRLSHNLQNLRTERELSVREYLELFLNCCN